MQTRFAAGSSNCETLFDYAGRTSAASTLEGRMAEADFWNDAEKAQATVAKLKQINAVLKPLDEAITAVEDLEALTDLVREDESLEDELAAEVERVDELGEQEQAQDLPAVVVLKVGIPHGVAPVGHLAEVAARAGEGVGDRAPLDVVREGVAVAFLDVAVLDRIGRHDGRRRQDQVVGPVELLHPVIEAAAGELGASDLVHGELQSLFDVPDHLRLQQVAVALQQALLGGGELHGAQGLEHHLHVGEVRARLLDDAAHLLEHLGRLLHDGGDLPVDRRDAAEIGA